MKAIRTARLYLLPVHEENAQTLWEVIQQPDLRDFQDLPDVDLAAFRRSIAQRPKELRPSVAGRFEWLVYWSGAHENGDAEPLGWVSLRVAERATERAEIGYSIVRAHRRRGIATEAVAGLVAEAFERARLESVRAYCVPENASSRTVLERNGFSQEGVSRHGASVQGQPVDVVAYSLEREHWRSHSAAPRRNRLATRS